MKPPKLHYRAPTAPGSSGSPVFNKDWQLVALHHSSVKRMPAPSGTGTVEANEGISIGAIKHALGHAFATPAKRRRGPATPAKRRRGPAAAGARPNGPG